MPVPARVQCDTRGPSSANHSTNVQQRDEPVGLPGGPVQTPTPEEPTAPDHACARRRPRPALDLGPGRREGRDLGGAKQPVNLAILLVLLTSSGSQDC